MRDHWTPTTRAVLSIQHQGGSGRCLPPITALAARHWRRFSAGCRRAARVPTQPRRQTHASAQRCRAMHRHDAAPHRRRGRTVPDHCRGNGHRRRVGRQRDRRPGHLPVIARAPDDPLHRNADGHPGDANCERALVSGAGGFVERRARCPPRRDRGAPAHGRARLDRQLGTTSRMRPSSAWPPGCTRTATTTPRSCMTTWTRRWHSRGRRGAAARAASFLSSVRADGEKVAPSHAFNRAVSPPSSGCKYARSKAQGRSGARDDQGDVVVVRSPLVYGPGVGATSSRCCGFATSGACRSGRSTINATSST